MAVQDLVDSFEMGDWDQRISCVVGGMEYVTYFLGLGRILLIYLEWWRLWRSRDRWCGICTFVGFAVYLFSLFPPSSTCKLDENYNQILFLFLKRLFDYKEKK